MQISKGKTRIAVIFENFVVKLPRIYFRQAFKKIWKSFRSGDLAKCLGYGLEVYGSPKRLLFRGVWENWGEFRFYRLSRSRFLMPTYFSLFGMLNIQKRGNKKAKIEDVNLWCQLCEMTNNEVWADGHTFSNANNFCDDDGKLVMVDYGNARIHDVLNKYGDKIFKDFDFAYVYHKKKLLNTWGDE